MSSGSVTRFNRCAQVSGAVSGSVRSMGGCVGLSCWFAGAGGLQGYHTLKPHESHKRFWKVLGRAIQEIPKDGVVHSSVKRRHEATGYEPKPLEAWLEANGGWGNLEP